MKRTEERTTLKPVKETVVLEHRCDLCGADKPERADWPEYPSDAGYGAFRVAETEVICKTGHCYPEGGIHTEVQFDICPQCFIEKLIPWMESQGAVPRTEDVDS